METERAYFHNPGACTGFQFHQDYGKNQTNNSRRAVSKEQIITGDRKPFTTHPLCHTECRRVLSPSLTNNQRRRQ